MNVFIDDYNLIRIESDKYINSVYLLDELLTFKEKIGNNQYFISKDVIPLHLANKIFINNLEYNLNIGLVTIKPDFNLRYKYDGKLGAIYLKDKTTFKVFTPVAKAIYLVLDNKKYQMNYNMPIWEVTISGNLVNKNYYYLVNINNKFEKVIDPYAIAGTEDYSTIIDLENTYKQKYNFLNFKNKNDAIIYEGHIRDLTINLNVLDKGNYLGLTNYSNELNKSVIEYIKDLGMTHLQLLPVQDFYEVDVLNKDKYYNWGYNPKQYFTLSSWYSNNPSSHYSKIDEFKQLIDNAHKNNLGVTLDVVYNHVYRRDLFPYDKLVPGYFYRHNKQFKPSNNTLVGNDIETTNYMVRKFIVDNLIFLTKTFKLDGFRFDLMGLLDIETMELIEKELTKINSNILLYGEGWNIDNELPYQKRSNMNNNKMFPYYGHFNDFYRNTIRGKQYSNERGFLTGNNNNLLNVFLSIEGSENIFNYYYQSINFVECHDNHTLNDQLIIYGIKKNEIKYYQDFANHLLAISKGIPFYHAGQEFYRSKNLINDSYNKPDSINGINYNIGEHTKKLKEILNIRKSYLNSNSDIYSFKILNNLIELTIINEKAKLICYIKNNFYESKIVNNNQNIFKSFNYKNKDNHIILTKPGIYIFKTNKRLV